METETLHYKALVAKLPLLKAEIGKVIIGQDEVIRLLLTAVFCQGHCQLVGVPGLAKTLLIQTIASDIDFDYFRYADDNFAAYRRARRRFEIAPVEVGSR